MPTPRVDANNVPSSSAVTPDTNTPCKARCFTAQPRSPFANSATPSTVPTTIVSEAALRRSILLRRSTTGSWATRPSQTSRSIGPPRRTTLALATDSLGKASPVGPDPFAVDAQHLLRDATAIAARDSYRRSPALGLGKSDDSPSSCVAPRFVRAFAVRQSHELQAMTAWTSHPSRAVFPTAPASCSTFALGSSDSHVWAWRTASARVRPAGVGRAGRCYSAGLLPIPSNISKASWPAFPISKSKLTPNSPN